MGQPFNPGNYYYVGGNSKLYGAVLLRYRAQNFEPVVYRDGATPGWPFSYEDLEPWYCLAETLSMSAAPSDSTRRSLRIRPPTLMTPCRTSRRSAKSGSA